MDERKIQETCYDVWHLLEDAREFIEVKIPAKAVERIEAAQAELEKIVHPRR